MVLEDYVKAKKLGEKAVRKADGEHTDPYLVSMEEKFGKELDGLTKVSIGIREIPLAMVEGTVTKGRQNSFAGNYMPLLDAYSEFAMKWQRVFEYQMEEGVSDPIQVYEYMKKFYVIEGNKRVSVLKYLEVPSIDAEIVRILPKKSDSSEYLLYEEFLQFYKVCPVYEITFSRCGSYQRFVQLLGYGFEKPWKSDTVRTVEACYYRFYTLFKENGGLSLGNLTVGDALLVYLSVYSFMSLIDQPRSVLMKRLQSVWSEIKAAGEKDVLVLDVKPSTKARRPLVTLFSRPVVYNEENPLHAYFFYTESDSFSVEDQEVGRYYLNARYEGLIKTVSCTGCHDDDTLKKEIEKAIQEDAEVIITTEPRMMPQTLKSAIEYKKVRFLNRSLNIGTQSVHTYECRMYEVKFLLGALAASLCENHKIGYVAHMPVYGALADINAFAIGAALIDPLTRVYLAWDTDTETDWHEIMGENEIEIVSGPDLAQDLDSMEYGLYRKTEDAIFNLAQPVYNWGKYYELLIGAILNGSYDDSVRPMNYWYGIATGVIDLQVSSSLPYPTRKLVDLLKDAVVNGTMNPFDGELRSQNSVIQDEKAATLSTDRIIRMDWLNDNVIGKLPEKDILKESAKENLTVSGVTPELKKTEEAV